MRFAGGRWPRWERVREQNAWPGTAGRATVRDGEPSLIWKKNEKARHDSAFGFLPYRLMNEFTKRILVLLKVTVPKSNKHKSHPSIQPQLQLHLTV